MEIRVGEDLREANNRVASRVRELLGRKGILTLDLLSSPGSGKTTLIQRTLEKLKEWAVTAVIVGDVQTSRDQERIRKAGFEAIQINTGGGCHLTASMVEGALGSLDLEHLDILFIENVGNLVCPAGFNLGEDIKVVLLSTTEGDDKPAKYPAAFLAAGAMVITKKDLLGVVPFDPEAARRDALKINPRLKIFELSAFTGEGMEEWVSWVRVLTKEKRRDSLSRALDGSKV